MKGDKKKMVNKNQKCPYRFECKKIKEKTCVKLERYRECGDFMDFELEKSGLLDVVVKNVIGNFAKTRRRDLNHEITLKQCQYKWKCEQVFIRPCNYCQMNNECHVFECEDCEFYLPDFDKYCDTADYKKCSSYEMISVLKEAYEADGIHNTQDLKNRFGLENYDWLGGFIRCAFLEPADIE